jgi:hypothetical protein
LAGTTLADVKGVQGRRSSSQLKFTEARNGVLRLLCDVVVQRHTESEWVAISRQPAVVGETLLIDIIDGEQPQQWVVCVIESRPFVLDGDMRYRIRMHADDPPPILFEQQVRRG